jgi:hypothetical protein
MYFKSTLEFGPDVYYDLRTNDTSGIYLTIEQFHNVADYIIHSGYDGIAELCTETHVTNIPVTADRIMQQIVHWKHLEPTHVRLDQQYREVI